LQGVLARLFGVLSYLTPILFLLIAILLFKQNLKEESDQHFYFRTYLGTFLLIGSIAGLIHIFAMGENGSAFSLASEGRAGGFLGALFAGPANSLLGFWAGCLVLLALLVIGILVAFNVSLIKLLPRKEVQVPEPQKGQNPQEVKINAMSTEGFVAEKVVDKNKKLPAEQAMEDYSK
jgi:hypothetical protein